MSIIATLFIVFLITVLVLVTFTVVALTSSKNAMYNDVVNERDALEKLVRANQNTENTLQEMTDEELRTRASDRW